MSTYVIGDIQGCHEAFLELLQTVDFDPARDKAWITGDLVNRGEDSLAVLRWCMAHDHAVVAVLGNHDLHLLAVAEGYVPPHRKDTLEMILGAPDRQEVLAWLRHRPMVHRQGNWLMVHAGLSPDWSGDDAEIHARELENALRGQVEEIPQAHVWQRAPPLEPCPGGPGPAALPGQRLHPYPLPAPGRQPGVPA